MTLRFRNLRFRNLRFCSWLAGLALCSTVLPYATMVVAQVEPVRQGLGQAPPSVRMIGQVNPSSTVDVVVTNDTSATLGVGFSGGANVKIEPGEKATVSFAVAPANLFIYPFRQSAGTKYNVTLSGNTMNVQVTPMKTVASGDSALNVSRSGMVYVN